MINANKETPSKCSKTFMFSQFSFKRCGYLNIFSIFYSFNGDLLDFSVSKHENSMKIESPVVK